MIDSAALGSGPEPVTPAPKFWGWHMVARGFLCQNVSTGFLFGTFGTTLLAVQDRLHLSRATVSLGMALALLTMGLLSPLIARMLDRMTLPRTMICGIILSSAGYVVLAVAPNSLVLLSAYALLIGPGIAMFGPLPTSILASNWFVVRQGTAVGIANVPFFVAIAPLASLALLDGYGLTTLYLCLVAGHLLLLPVALTIIERPELIGQHPFGAGPVTPTAEQEKREIISPPVSLLSRKAFWVMVAGGGTLNAAGIIAISHIVALAVERGISALQASSLVSVMGAGSIVGALLVGVLCDRLGPARALALAALGYAAAWCCILVTTGLPALVVAVGLHGLSSGGVFSAISVLARHLFGGAAMGRAVGLFLPLTLPFTFFFPPIAGWIRDVTGSYNIVAAFLMASSILVSTAFIGLWYAERRQTRRLNSAAPV